MKKDKHSLRIAMLGHKRVPSREGGVEIVVEELSTRMVERGHRVVLYNRRGSHVSGREHDGEKQKQFKGVKLKRVLTIDKKGLAAVTAGFFATLRAAFGGYDVVHFHAEGSCAFLWLARLLGKRCIVTVHGLDWKREKWKSGFGSKYIKFGERIAAKWAHEIIVLSEGVRDYFRDTYHRETHFIPNGVARPAVQDAAWVTEEFGLTKDSYLLFLGRIVPEKGLRYMVEAFRRVKTDKYLVIAGGSSDTQEFFDEIREMAAGDDRIIFTGFVSGRPLEELYSNAYLYMLPSDLEGMPLSLLEAMSYGNCCLTSDITECADVMEDHGVTFPRADTDKLAEVLQRLCDNPAEVDAYKAGAADFITNKYNWDTVVDKTMELYKGKH